MRPERSSVFFNDTATTEIYTLSLHDALPISSLLGSPLGHDHCSISLSDLLTPWQVIRERVRAAAEADFVVSLYNPRSKGRDWQLGKAREILLEHRSPDTPVGIVKNAYREGQTVILANLGDRKSVV